MSLKKKQTGFTMVEVLFVIMLISTTFMGIITTVISTTNYLSATKQRVTALNLAKEGVEIMYNIRNTNWRRWDNQKDLTRLKNDPFSENEGKAIDEWITPGRWIIKAKTGDTTNNKYFSLVKISDSGGDLSGENALQRDAAKLQEEIFGGNYLNGEYKLHFLSGNRYNNQDLDSFEGEDISIGEYRRYIAVDGLYKKGETNNTNKLNCPQACDGVDCSCGDSTAKELRFCSVVVYTRPRFGSVGICAIMTNFEE